jgi:hypothetical protein
MAVTKAQINAAVPLSMRQLGLFEPVTPNDGADLAFPCIGLNVVAAGTVKIHDLAGNAVTIQCVSGWNPAPCKRVWATGTTATGIVAVY